MIWKRTALIRNPMDKKLSRADLIPSFDRWQIRNGFSDGDGPERSRLGRVVRLASPDRLAADLDGQVAAAELSRRFRHLGQNLTGCCSQDDDATSTLGNSKVTGLWENEAQHLISGLLTCCHSMT